MSAYYVQITNIHPYTIHTHTKHENIPKLYIDKYIWTHAYIHRLGLGFTYTMLHTPTIHTQILQTYIHTHTYYIICIWHSHTYITYVHTYIHIHTLHMYIHINHHIHKHGHTHYNGHMVITCIYRLWSGGVLILFIL